MEYRGFIFFGLMLTKDGPKVLEYNCRLGDPETQAILLRADFDFAAACMDAARGKARWFQCEVDPGSERVRGDGVGGLSVQPRFGKADRWAGGSGEGSGTWPCSTRERDAKENNYYTSGGEFLVWRQSVILWQRRARCCLRRG